MSKLSVDLLGRVKSLLQDLEREVEKSTEFPELFVKAFDVIGDHGDEYIVSKVQRTTWECTCPDYRFRRRECKHIMRQKTELGLFGSISEYRPRSRARVSA